MGIRASAKDEASATRITTKSSTRRRTSSTLCSSVCLHEVSSKPNASRDTNSSKDSRDVVDSKRENLTWLKSCSSSHQSFSSFSSRCCRARSVAACQPTAATTTTACTDRTTSPTRCLPTASITTTTFRSPRCATLSTTRI